MRYGLGFSEWLDHGELRYPTQTDWFNEGRGALLGESF